MELEISRLNCYLNPTSHQHYFYSKSARYERSCARAHYSARNSSEHTRASIRAHATPSARTRFHQSMHHRTAALRKHWSKARQRDPGLP
jgi:hypothetical protein